MATPNVYQLHGGHLSITYSTTGLGGRPSFEYQDELQSLTFQGDEIRVVESEIGNLVSVSIRRTVDAGSTSFTLLVPVVNLAGLGQQVHITTYGITTMHRFSVIPLLNKGQMELYKVTQLTGIAEAVAF